MTGQEEIFFALVRRGLFGVEVPRGLLVDADWEALLQMAKEQTVVGVISEAVSTLPADLQPPKGVMQKLLAHYMMNLKAHALLDDVLAETVRFYREHGIEGVLLKGQGIARCYPTPTMRQCGDIDYYVGPDVYDRALDLTKRKWQEGAEHTLEVEKHYHFSHRGVTIELHRHAAFALRPWLNKDFQRWITSALSDEGGLRHAEIGGVDVKLPPATFDAVYVMYHALYHLMAFEGVGLRQLCDWARVLYVYHDEIDLKELEQVLRRFSLLKSWQIMGYIAVNFLGLPEKFMPFYTSSVCRKAMKVLDYIMELGNFGKKLKHDKGYKLSESFVKRKFEVMSWHTRSVMRMLSVAPVDVSSNLAYYLVDGVGRAIKKSKK